MPTTKFLNKQKIVSESVHSFLRLIRTCEFTIKTKYIQTTPNSMSDKNKHLVFQII